MPCEDSSTPATAGVEGPRLQLGDIFRAHGEAYRKTHALTPEQRKAMRDIEACRTEVLGGRLEVCDRCGHAKAVYHSCRNRHCPTCQSLSQARWLERRMQRFLPTDYFHVVFTVPDGLLNGLILQNRRRFFEILFASASQTLLDLAADPQRLGAQLGITAVLHTWTRDLRFHTHLHCIVTGGGLSLDGQRWIPTRQNYLFPGKVMGELFRGKLLDALADAHRAGQLALEGPCELLRDPKHFARLQDSLRKKNWVVYAKKPFAAPDHVFRYLGRYTHRVGISNQRLLSLDDQGVLFRTKGDKSALLHPLLFIGRFLQHVLPTRFVKIRHFGLHASANATTKLELARQRIAAQHPAVSTATAALIALSLAATPPPEPPAPEDWRALLLRLTGIDPSRCPRYGIGTLMPTPLFLPPPAPPDDTS